MSDDALTDMAEVLEREGGATATLRIGDGPEIPLSDGPGVKAAVIQMVKGKTKGKAKPPMKKGPEDTAAEGAAQNVAGEELRQFIERYERLEAEKKDIMDGQKAVMGEAKSRGYDVKCIRKIIAIRKRDKDDLDEENAVMQMYMAALGMDY